MAGWMDGSTQHQTLIQEIVVVERVSFPFPPASQHFIFLFILLS